MIDHCVSAFSKRQKEKSYRIYLTDALKTISENTYGEKTRAVMTKRWIDIVEPKVIKETRSAKDIIENFKSRLNKGGEIE